MVREVTTAAAPALKVYAPGMTCVYAQLLRGKVPVRWSNYRFFHHEHLTLYDDPITVLVNIFAGEVERTSTLYMDRERFLREQPLRVQYDVLAIESRWLLYTDTLLNIENWSDLERALSPFFEKEIYFFDIIYPHIGQFFSHRAVRNLRNSEIERWHRRSELKHRFLKLLMKFKHVKYIDNMAIAAHLGYHRAFIDQPEHYTPEYCEYFAQAFLEELAQSRIEENTKALDRLLDSLAERPISIEVLGDLRPMIKSTEPIVRFKVTAGSQDPLLCPTQFLVSWHSEVDAAMDWSLYVVEKGVIRWKKRDTDSKLIANVNRQIAFKTMGRYTMTVDQ